MAGRAWAVLAGLLLMQAVGVHLFLGGFFLTRVELAHSSTCADDLPMDPSAPEHCWMPAPPRFRKAVVLVVDALRYDFVAPWTAPASDVSDDADASLDDPLDVDLNLDLNLDNDPNASPAPPSTSATAPGTTTPPPPPYVNHLQVVHDLLQAGDGTAMLARFDADPPTVTAQRLKGLTTGSMPTFLDAGQNFQSPAIREDNWLRHARQQLPGRLVFMGDDTWTALYPDTFDTAFPFPSFNVWDLHTVDEGVAEHLVPQLRAGNWSVVVAHMLGVDHVGHRHGPSHPAMAAKLQQVNNVIASVVQELDSDTLLVVMGDHGMTPDGNHGGATPDETAAALFMYSKGGVLNTQATADTPHVAQVDVVPTLSLLLGLPVPFSSVGAAMPDVNYAPQDAPQDADAAYLAAVRRTAAQVDRYLAAYADAVNGSADARVLLDAAAAHRQAATELNDAEAFQRYLRAVRTVCQRAWTQFNVPLMVWGAAALSLSALCMLLLAFASPEAVEARGPYPLSAEEAMAAVLPDDAGAKLRVSLRRITLQPAGAMALGAAVGALAWLASCVGVDGGALPPLPPASWAAAGQLLLGPSAVFPLGGAVALGTTLGVAVSWVTHRRRLTPRTDTPASGMSPPPRRRNRGAVCGGCGCVCRAAARCRRAALALSADTPLRHAHWPSAAAAAVFAMRIAALMSDNYIKAEADVLVFMSAAVAAVLGVRAVRRGAGVVAVSGLVAALWLLTRAAHDHALDRLAPMSSRALLGAAVAFFLLPATVAWASRRAMWRRCTASVALWACVVSLGGLFVCLYWSLQSRSPNATRDHIPRAVYGSAVVSLVLVVATSRGSRRPSAVFGSAAEQEKQPGDELTFDFAETMVGMVWPWQPHVGTATVLTDFDGQLLVQSHQQQHARRRRQQHTVQHAPPLGRSQRDGVQVTLMLAGSCMPVLALLLGPGAGVPLAVMLGHAAALLALLHVSTRAGFVQTAKWQSRRRAPVPRPGRGAGTAGHADADADADADDGGEVRFHPTVAHVAASPASLPSFDAVLAWSLLVSLHFYGTGHDMRFSALDFSSGFLGFTSAPFSLVRSAVLVLLNTFAAHAVGVLALPLVVLLGFSHACTLSEGGTEGGPADGPNARRSGVTDLHRSARLMKQVGRQVAADNAAGATQLYHVVLALLGVQSLQLAATAWFVAAQRRHLMVWATFAPKFVFEAATALVCGVLAVGAWPVWMWVLADVRPRSRG